MEPAGRALRHIAACPKLVEWAPVMRRAAVRVWIAVNVPALTPVAVLYRVILAAGSHELGVFRHVLLAPAADRSRVTLLRARQ